MYSYEEIKIECGYGFLSRQGLLQKLAREGEFDNCYYVIEFAETEEEKSSLLIHHNFLKETILKENKEHFLKLYKKIIEKNHGFTNLNILPRDINRYYPSFPPEWGYEIIDYLIEKYEHINIENEYHKVLKLFMKKMRSDFSINKDWLKKLVKHRNVLDSNERYYLGEFLQNGHEKFDEWAAKENNIYVCPKCGFYNSINNIKCDLCELNFEGNTNSGKIPLNEM